MSPEDQERIAKINALLDDQVRPYLQGDGGDLHVLGLEGNTLTVHYQGACGSCPSSMSGTLTGIENLVKSIEPDIEVVAVSRAVATKDRRESATVLVSERMSEWATGGVGKVVAPGLQVVDLNDTKSQDSMVATDADRRRCTP